MNSLLLKHVKTIFSLITRAKCIICQAKTLALEDVTNLKIKMCIHFNNSFLFENLLSSSPQLFFQTTCCTINCPYSRTCLLTVYGGSLFDLVRLHIISWSSCNCPDPGNSSRGCHWTMNMWELWQNVFFHELGTPGQTPQVFLFLCIVMAYSLHPKCPTN